MAEKGRIMKLFVLAAALAAMTTTPAIATEFLGEPKNRPALLTDSVSKSAQTAEVIGTYQKVPVLLGTQPSKTGVDKVPVYLLGQQPSKTPRKVF